MGPRTAFPLVALAAAALLMASAVGVSAAVSVAGNPVRGKALFVHNQVLCKTCHTLKEANSTGRDGPNLDKRKPSYAKIVDVITKGRNPTRRWPTGMTRYAGSHAILTKAQIRDIAAFVYAATRR